MLYPYTMQYYSSFKKQVHKARCDNRNESGRIMLIEICQSQKDKYGMIPFP